MFWEIIKRNYDAGSAHQFLLHFNVNDLLYDDLYGYLPARDYIMEQLNALGCELVLGYNTSEGIHLPNIGRWRSTQKMLEVLPKYEQTGVFHFQSMATWLQTFRRLREVEDVNPHEDMVDPLIARKRINATLAFNKVHEDPFMHIEPNPSEELQVRLNRLLQQNRAKVGLVINSLEQLAPNDPSLNSASNDDLQRFFTQVQNWASDLEIRRRGHIILLLTHNTYDIHPNFTVNPEIPLVEIPFPNYDERLRFIEHLHVISEPKAHIRASLKDENRRRAFAHETIGLNLFGIHDVVKQAETARENVGGEALLRYRRESLKTFSRGILELGETHRGNASADGWYAMWTIKDIADGMRHRDLRRVPRGMLFLGPPGTGKVYAAKLLAGEARMTFVQLRYASQVGEISVNVNEGGDNYERNLKAALNFIRGISPAVVFIDEIEQVPPHTQLHPEERPPLPQSLVNAISDPSLHGRVIWVGASCRPDLMPQIFRRYGVFDTKLIMLPPIGAGRVEILKIFCQGQENGLNFRALVENAETDGLTSRDLFLIVQRANNIARRHRRENLTDKDLREALDDFIPDYSPEMQLFMGLLALREANSRFMIPDALLPAYQEFVHGNQIDKTGINKRLMELSEQLGLN